MRAVIIGTLAFLAPFAAWAQSKPSPFSLFGSVQSIGPTSLAIKEDNGTAHHFTLGDKLLVLQNRAITLAEIQAGDFVASAAMRGRDGKLHSTELRVFPEALRGLGEGQRPMNDARQQTMTNATVTGTAVVDGSNHIKVQFAGGDSELVLDPGVPVIRIEQVERSAIREGSRVRVQGAGQAASRVTLQ